MVLVCAWCNRFLGLKEPSDRLTVTHGICRACIARQAWTDTPSLVVSRGRQDLLPVLQELLQGSPEIRLFVDRRACDRRSALDASPSRERRRGDDRRRGSPLMVV